MKIIKEADVTWTYTFTCSQCDAQLEADINDLKCYQNEGKFNQTSYDSYSVKCPKCNTSRVVPESSLSKAVKFRAKQNKLSL